MEKRGYLRGLGIALATTAGLLAALFFLGNSGSEAARLTVQTTGSLTLTDHTWDCKTAVDLDSVTVDITAASTAKDAVHLLAGCTGRIGDLEITNALGDGVKVGPANDLQIDGGTITCTGRLATVHQDGIQAMSGSNVTFSNMTVDCPTANNAGFFVNHGSGTQPIPNAIIFTNGTIFGTTSSTAYVTDNQTNSGVTYSTLCPSKGSTARAYRKGALATAIDIGNTIPESC